LEGWNMTQRTELQILMQGLAALSLEMRAMTMAVRAPDFVCAKMHELQAEANRLMQSAQTDADLLAFVKQTQEAGVQTQFIVHGEPLGESAEPKSAKGSGD